MILLRVQREGFRRTPVRLLWLRIRPTGGENARQGGHFLTQHAYTCASRHSESRRVVRSDLRQLRTVILAAEYESFSAAASRLNTETSAVSRSIRDLESRLGVLLFERSSRGVRPTVAGEAYIHAAKDILERLELAERAVQAAGRGEVGELNIGCALSFGSKRILALTKQFSTSSPGIEVRAHEGTTEDLTRAVQRGFLDAAIVLSSNPEDFEKQHENELCRLRLGTERIVLTADRPSTQLTEERSSESKPILVRSDPAWTTIAAR